MKAGELSAVEVMKGHLDRIDEMNPLLNGLVQRLSREECLKQALEADQRRVEGLALGKPELVYIKFYRGGFRAIMSTSSAENKFEMITSGCA